MAEFIEITDDGRFFTSKMPADETLVEVRLQNGETCRAYFCCNIAEGGDWDFLPVLGDGGPDIEGDSLAGMVVAWRMPDNA